MGAIFTAVLLLFVAISVVWSIFVRKLIKTRIRSISVIACVVLALIGTITFKNTILDPAFIKDTLLPMVSSSFPAEVSDLINASTILLETIIGLPIALVTPLIFIVLYVVLSLLASIVYLFILIFAGRKLRKSEKNNVPYAKVRGIVWSAVSAALALVVILLPVAFYGGLVDDVVGALAEAEVMDAETADMVTGEFVTPIVDSTVVQMFRAFGGDAMINELTGFEVDGDTVYIKDEIGAVAELVSNIMPLAQAGEPQNYGEKEADSLVAVANSLSKSKFLTAIAAEAVYFLTEDIVNGDEPISLDESGMFDGLINNTLEIVHEDAKDTKKFTADIKTVAEMASALIKGGVLSNMNDTDALFEELAGGDTIKNVIVVLGKNNSMKCLIPEVTNIGIKAIASFVEVKADAEEAYNDLMNTLAEDLNNVEVFDDESQTNDFSSKLADALDNAGIAVNKETVELYAATMVQDLVIAKGGADVTAEDVQNFFATANMVTTIPVANVEEFEKATLLVFLNELVIDVDEAAKLITNETVEGEAEAIGGIFAEAGSLMNDVSGEVNIGTMAGSVGGILNSLQASVCVGEERTSKLFIAIVQSDVVREAANMDIATATDLGIKGSTGENVDYEKTFKTISNAVDVLQNMNSNTEGGMTTEDLTTVLKDLNPQTAGMLESYITEDRLAEDYGLSEEESSTAAPLISDVFGYMGSADMTEEECAKEAEALNDVMTLVTSANDKANSGETSETVFGGENSVLGKTADDTVKTFMSSESIKHSLNNNSESLGEDPFGMGDMMVQDGEKDEKLELENAMKDYYENTEYETEEDKAADRETMINLGKLFGFTQDEMHYILGE